jgi:hypothetical protein
MIYPGAGPFSYRKANVPGRAEKAEKVIYVIFKFRPLIFMPG